jgi:hypothetical protein
MKTKYYKPVVTAVYVPLVRLEAVVGSENGACPTHYLSCDDPSATILLVPFRQWPSSDASHSASLPPQESNIYSYLGGNNGNRFRIASASFDSPAMAAVSIDQYSKRRRGMATKTYKRRYILVVSSANWASTLPVAISELPQRFSIVPIRAT